MQSQGNQFKQLERYAKYVASFTLLLVILFSFYAIELGQRFSKTEQSWKEYNSRMANINAELAKLHAAIGYGGLIHHFKNYVARTDKQYLDLIDIDLTQLQSAISNLNQYFEYEEELVALETIQNVMLEYESKLALLKTSNHLSVSARDKLAKVNDTNALQAISFLKNRTFELNNEQKLKTTIAFKQAIKWMYIGTFLFFLILLLAYLLIKLIKNLQIAHSNLNTALEDSNLLMLHAPDAMISVTQEGEIVRCNLQMQSLFGYAENELIGQNLTLLLPKNTATKHKHHLHEYFKSPHHRLMGQGNTQLKGLHKDNYLIPIEVSLSSSTVSGIKLGTATIRDISSRIETEKKLKESIAISKTNYDKLKQAQLSLGETKMSNIMLEKIPSGTLLCDCDGKVLVVNDRFLIDTNYTRAELITLDFAELIAFEKTEDQIVFEKVATSQSTQANKNLTMLAKLKPKHDHFIPIELTISTYDYNKQVFRLITYKNLTELMLIQNRLIKSHEQLGRAVAATKDGIWEWNIDENTVNYSPQFMSMIGKKNEVLPKYEHWYDHIHPDFKVKVKQALAHHFKTQTFFEIEYLGLNEKGKYNWFVSLGDSIFDQDNKPLIMSGSLRNIDNSKRLEIETAEKSEFLNTIYEGSSHAIWVLNVEENNEFRFLEFNRAACDILGITEEQIINKTLSEITQTILKPNEANVLRDNYSRCRNNAEHIHYTEYLQFNKSDMWYQTDLYPILDAENKVSKIVGTAINITEQKHIEKEVESSKLFLEKIINSTICGLYLFDLKTNLNTTINTRYTDILGYSIEDLNNSVDFDAFYHPDDRAQLHLHINKVANARNSEVSSLKYRFKHKNGHWVWCYSFDCVVKFDNKGQPELMLGTFVDITEQTLLLEKLQSSNEYLERFAFVASHDLQEPLRKITAFSSSLMQRLKQQIDSDEHIEFEFSRLINASERMRGMIKDLLKLSRISSSQLDISEVSFSEVLAESIDLLSHLIEEEHAIIEMTDNTDILLKVDKGLFVQLLQNLIANSIKFKTKDKHPVIHLGLNSKDDVMEIIFKDNGIGIDPKFVEQIFEPFRRLHSKDKYVGSGIGLALCQQILAVHNGTISCSSDTSEGSEFRIILPRINIKGL